jgi:molecular chaperone IbpA
VSGAHLDNGLLHIELQRVVPEEAKPRSIKIGRGPATKVIDEKAA